MYVLCKIQWIDNGEIWEVIFKTNDEFEFDQNDEIIFFYGMTRAELEEAASTGAICEGEWKVLEVIRSSDNIHSL